MNPLLQWWWGRPGVGAALAAIFLLEQIISSLTEGPLPLPGARGMWRGADLSAIDLGRYYRENRS